eukprot:COSAG02_NODE_410_length_22875_cov_43.282755_16_plen_229_part_00
MIRDLACCSAFLIGRGLRIRQSGIHCRGRGHVLYAYSTCDTIVHVLDLVVVLYYSNTRSMCTPVMVVYRYCATVYRGILVYMIPANVSTESRWPTQPAGQIGNVSRMSRKSRPRARGSAWNRRPDDARRSRNSLHDRARPTRRSPAPASASVHALMQGMHPCNHAWAAAARSRRGARTYRRVRYTTLAAPALRKRVPRCRAEKVRILCVSGKVDLLVDDLLLHLRGWQ